MHPKRLALYPGNHLAKGQIATTGGTTPGNYRDGVTVNKGF